MAAVLFINENHLLRRYLYPIQSHQINDVIVVLNRDLVVRLTTKTAPDYSDGDADDVVALEV